MLDEKQEFQLRKKIAREVWKFLQDNYKENTSDTSFYKHPLFTETVLDTVLDFLFDVNPVTQITMTMIHQSLARTSSRVISEEAQKFMAMAISEEEEEEGGETVH
tara:strand:- start:1 stop:315 length:315 start_codon:yes stop_codon:yes gene_type:complete